MEKIRIVTDSTAYLSESLLAQHPEITAVIPLYVRFGETSYREGVDLSTEDFYKKLVSSSQLPTTSQPSAGDFKEIYQPLLEQGYSIISIHISAELSGTVASAIAAREMLEGRIEVVDSRFSGMGLGFMALEAARAIRAGKSMDEVLAWIKAVRDGISIIFLVDTLHYLHKGGRIGGAQALLGSLLKIKPILYLHEGRIEPLEKVRTSRRGVERLIEMMEEMRNEHPQAKLRMAVHHSAALEKGEELAKVLKDRFQPEEIHLCELGGVIGTHTGPGLLAFCAFFEQDGTILPKKQGR